MFFVHHYGRQRHSQQLTQVAQGGYLRQHGGRTIVIARRVAQSQRRRSPENSGTSQAQRPSRKSRLRTYRPRTQTSVLRQVQRHRFQRFQQISSIAHLDVQTPGYGSLVAEQNRFLNRSQDRC
eukprot:Gregarina_sp_Pseudo_9__4665@NODE_485_length_2725_cov_6_155249_g457_i0_p5_GENE_NODE_485_length_2725_cov_6_155249_g457_i0NODE_485_length_2725_cov_6_155249_g457_i0_p5_ORF_typecomplete_len123_score2_95PCO_ADO/PF07847_12/0_0011Peptidase_M85/PF13678_6/0_043_NODE_485_length_2725_cov_6_155249_g457_i0310678